MTSEREQRRQQQRRQQYPPRRNKITIRTATRVYVRYNGCVDSRMSGASVLMNATMFCSIATRSNVSIGAATRRFEIIAPKATGGCLQDIT